MALPAVLYFLQNMLYYIALERVRSATFSVLIQLKLLTTAVFSVFFLGRKLLGFQWRALLLLFVGVVLVQTRSMDGLDGFHSDHQHESVAQGSTAQSAPIGEAIMSGECLRAWWPQHCLKLALHRYMGVFSPRPPCRDYLVCTSSGS